MTELTKRLRLYLADTLTGNVKLLTNLLKGSCASVLKAEPKLKNVLLSGCKRMENLIDLLLEKRVGCGLRGCGSYPCDREPCVYGG